MTDFVRTGFLVRVCDRRLLVVEVPAIPVLSVPASTVRIATPRSQRRLSDGSLLRIDDELWSVQFGSVYQVEAARSGRRGLRRAVFGSACGLGGPSGLGGSGRLGRSHEVYGPRELDDSCGPDGAGELDGSRGSDASRGVGGPAAGFGVLSRSGGLGGLGWLSSSRGFSDSRSSNSGASSFRGDGLGGAGDFDFCFGFGLGITTRRAARRGRELNTLFTAALLRAGAVDEDPPHELTRERPASPQRKASGPRAVVVATNTALRSLCRQSARPPSGQTGYLTCADAHHVVWMAHRRR